MKLSNYASFRSWLARSPVPERILASTPTGEKVLPVDTEAPKWAGILQRSLLTLGATALEAQDSEGNTHRACKVDLPEDSDVDSDLSLDSVPVPQNENAQMLALFATLLSRAYKDGSSAQRESSDAAFRMLVALAESAFKRLDAVERALHRARVGGDVVEVASPSTPGLEGLLGALMQGQQLAMQQKMAAAASPAVNGAAEAAETEEGEGE
jgi:hypothetical protein